MLRTTEKNFKYHEFYTDSENFVKDIAKLLSLGYTSDEIRDTGGSVVGNSLPIISENWQIVYPAVDRRQFPEVEDWSRLTADEYNKVTKWQIAQITDTAIIKTATTPKKTTKSVNTGGFGFDADLTKESCEMHLEIYMPPYLCDTETSDPLLQREGQIPEVIDRRGFNAKSPNKKVIRNYYHAFFRIFDNLNPAGDGPAENEYDQVTNEIIRWNSRASEWSKLSWYNDFEDVYISALEGRNERGMLDGMVRLPIEPGISMQTKIKLWGNVNRDRLVLSCMGSPNIDFGDDRYLIGCAYVGALDSFDFSIHDVAGNFGIFTTSSSVPAIGETTVNTRPSRRLGEPGMMDDPNKPGTQIVDPNVPIETTSGTMYTATKIKSIVLDAFPSIIDKNTAPEFSFALPILRDVPKDSTKADGGANWGTTYIDAATVMLEFQAVHYLTNSYSGTRHIEYVESATGVVKNLPVGTDQTKNMTITAFKVEIDPDNRKSVKIVVDTDKFLTEIKLAYGIPVDISAVKFNKCNPTRTSFLLYTQYTTQIGGVTRDKFGNIISIAYKQRFGKNSANSTTDFAMYHTFGKDYFQKHHFMFTTTEEFMQKELYGKSTYTGEYFADRIKIVHGSEGPRGILRGMITIDTSSLYPFDELIVNKDFKKYSDEPEELFVYLPITSQYCPFSNAPNGRHGIGILKEIRYPDPVSDVDFVEAAIRELERKYSVLHYIVDDVRLIDTSELGLTITWESNNTTAIKIQ